MQLILQTETIPSRRKAHKTQKAKETYKVHKLRKPKGLKGPPLNVK